MPERWNHKWDGSTGTKLISLCAVPLIYYFDFYFEHALGRITNLAKGGQGQIDNPSFDKGSSIIDLYDDGFTVSNIRDFNFGAKWQFFMGSCFPVLVETLATGRFPRLEFGCVKRSLAGLHIPTPM